MGVAHLVGDRRDAAAALAAFTIAQKGLPNDADVWAEIAESHRTLGNWNEATVAFDKAIDLDPHNRGLLQSLGFTHVHTRRYAEAVRALDRAAMLAAAEPASLNTIALEKARTYILWRGQLDTLRSAADRISWDAERRFVPALEYVQLLFWERRTDSLLVVLRSVHTPLLQSSTLLWPTSLLAAWTHQLRGDGPAARAAFDSALVLMDRLIVIQRESDNTGLLHAARGLALAGLGRHKEALRDARWLGGSAPLRSDATVDPLLRESQARIYAQVGYADRALDEIERLLAEPSLVSVHTLRLDPLWDPIRDHLRFRALLVKYGT
jgi:tetratricopeptide (TPR) repeat protein